jgi:hypothetical protein
VYEAAIIWVCGWGGGVRAEVWREPCGKMFIWRKDNAEQDVSEIGYEDRRWMEVPSVVSYHGVY